MSSTDRLLTNALNMADGTFFVTGSQTLSTTVSKITLPDVQSQIDFRMKIVNASTGSTHNLAYMVTPKGSAAPSFTANTAATGGSLVLPLTTEFVTINSSKDLYVVASAVQCNWQITFNFSN